MKRARVVRQASVLLFALAFAPWARAQETIALASDPTWGTYDADPAAGPANLLGPAQFVCMTPNTPAACPAGALVYTCCNSGWNMSLASLPTGASWIWAPGITPSSPADLEEFFFSKSFFLAGSATGTLSVAVDDLAEVLVNGTSLGSHGSITNVGLASHAQSSLMQFTLTPLLVPGWNTLTIRGQNGPGSFAGCTGCTYAQNAAGVVFGGAIAVEAARYCTAGTSASGCQAILSSVGIPSATATSGFDLIAASVEGAKDGQFFFGTNGQQASPWGNGTSFQCVVPPVKRCGILAGTGTVGACDGLLSQDLNALWCATCPKPNHNPGTGAVVQAQLWYRDPANTSNQSTSLSDAIQFAVTP
jgi:hypothetical protein